MTSKSIQVPALSDFDFNEIGIQALQEVLKYSGFTVPDYKNIIQFLPELVVLNLNKSSSEFPILKKDDTKYCIYLHIEYDIEVKISMNGFEVIYDGYNIIYNSGFFNIYDIVEEKNISASDLIHALVGININIVKLIKRIIIIGS